jgi:hypothetical protein
VGSAGSLNSEKEGFGASPFFHLLYHRNLGLFYFLCKFKSIRFFPCPPLLIFVFGMRAWIGRGGAAAIRESAGRAFCFHPRNQKRFRNERRPACGPASSHGKTCALWFREVRCCPRAPAGALKYMIPFIFCKSAGAFFPFLKTRLELLDGLATIALWFVYQTFHLKAVFAQQLSHVSFFRQKILTDR